jgi:cysteine desulfurase
VGRADTFVGMPATTTVYLDHAATTPIRPEVLAAMAEVWAEIPGNPTGSHAAARRARRRIDDARDVVAAATGAGPGGVVFTSGGTEADNLAVASARPGRPVCSAVEHPAVLRPVERAGGAVVGVDAAGRLDLAALAAVLADGAGLVSIMLANNETGVVQDLAAVADVVALHAPGARLHTDAVQGAAWLDLPTAVAPADLVSLSAHKVGGPMGVGALVVRDGGPVEPLLVGGGQERDRRAGTPDVAGIVGFAVALECTLGERAERVAATLARRDRLVTGIAAAVPGVVHTPVARGAAPEEVVAGIAHLCIEGVDREALLFLLDEAGLAASAAASCSSGAQGPSGVLAAMGVEPGLARGALRLSLGWSTTDRDVERAVGLVVAAVARLQARA